MKDKMEQFPAINSNPVLNVGKDGTVLYSNEAGEPLLREWGMAVGEKLPAIIGDIVQKVITRNNPEKMEVKVGKSVYLVVFHPLYIQECVNISGFDISDKKELEEKPLESEEKYQDLFNLIEQAVQIGKIVFDEKGQPIDNIILDVNLAYEKLSGLRREQIIGRGFKELLPIVEQKWLDRYGEVVRTGTGMHFEEYNASLNRWFEAFVSPMVDNRFIAVFSDITKRKQAEHQLSNELARATGLYELYTRSSNLSDRELYDFALNQAVKITDSTIGFFHLVSEDEKEIILTTWNQEALRSCTAGNEGHYPIEKAGNWVDCVRLKRPVVYNEFPSSPNQKGLPVGHATVKRFMSVPVTENGKVRIIFGVGNKVDEYDDRDAMQLQLVANELHKIMKLRRIENDVRESEVFLRNIIENVSDVIFVKDREARMILANPAYYRLMSKSPEEVFNKIVADFHPPEIARKLAEDDKRVMETGKGTTLEERIFTSNGWRIFQTVKAPYYDGQGNIIGLIGAARDITEHKKAEEALKKAYDNLEKLVKERTAELEKAYNSLKESERGFAEAQKMAHIGNWDWNLVTGEVCWSDELYRIFGRSPQQSAATYDEFLSYVHPGDRDRVNNAMKKGLNGEPIRGDYRIILANGEERIVHTEAEIIFYEENNPVQMKGTVQDITEIKRVEEQIRILANIVESSNDSIGTMSLDGYITSWNQEAEKVYGYSVEEVLGKPVSIFAPSHLDKEAIKLIEEIIHGKKVQRYETLRVRKDGMPINVSITLSPVFDSYGKLTAISFISRDITERKIIEEKLRESEEKYRNIVETANEGISIIDAEEIITFVNKKIEDMFGYSSEELIGRSMWDFISGESKAIIKQMLENGWKNVNESFEIKFIRKDGYPIWTHTNSKSLFDKDGKFFGTLNLHTDITKRKEAEEALRSFEIARKKEIHHRIKNNLQVISSLLDLQAEMFKGRNNIRDSEVMNAFAVSMDRVLSIALIHEELYKGENIDVLNFSQYLMELADNLLLTYRLETDVSLNLDLEEDLFLDMDAAIPLGIIINELVSNSLKYAFPDRDKGEIRIKLRREEKGGCKSNGCKSADFVLAVSDDGIGIPENLDIENLDSLGLQLVTSLVEQLDGELEVKRNNGTEFTIKFTITEKNNLA